MLVNKYRLGLSLLFHKHCFSYIILVRAKRYYNKIIFYRIIIEDYDFLCFLSANIILCIFEVKTSPNKSTSHP